MSHPHIPGTRSASGNGAGVQITIYSRGSLNRRDARELPAGPNLSQPTSGRTVWIPRAGSSISATPVDQGLPTSIPTSSRVRRQRNPSLMGPQAPEIVSEGKALPITQVTDSPPNLSASNRDIEFHQISTKLDEASRFWEGFNKAADFEDREFVKVLAGNLDSLLTFAGLFSGVITAFIIESLKTIQPDQAQMTNDLIRSVLVVLQNGTIEHPLHDEPFIPTHQRVRCTIVFFTSLCCSLSAAFGAVLGKQWLNHYEREGVLKPPPGRGRERQRKYEGRSYWHMEGIIETLPTILQISLFLFLIALVDFMFPVNMNVAYVVMGFSLVPALFYVVTTTIATLHPLSPFQTRLSITIRSTRRAPRYLLNHLKDMLKHPFIDLLKMTAVFFRTLLKRPPKRVWPLISFPYVILLFPLSFVWRIITLLPGGLWNFIVKGTTLPDAILDLKCIIFYAERASSSDALARVIEAIGTLPPDLKVDRNHPIITSFCETLFRFVIMPTPSITEARKDTSKLTNDDFRQLLKALRFLYAAWLHSEHPFENVQVTQCLCGYSRLTIKAICTIFSQEPRNVSTTSLIADILEVTSTFDDEPTGIDQALVLEHLQSPSLEDVDSLPYISLLSSNPTSQELPSIPTETEPLVRRLRSTMWINDQLDLNYARGRIRARVLSEYLGETEDDLRFSLYLTKCCENYLTIKEQEHPAKLIMRQSHAACKDYLGAIFSLLHRDKSGPWVQQFERDGTSSLLMRFFQPHWNNGLQGRALLCFVSLWYRGRNMNTPGVAVDGASQLYLTPYAVDSLVSKLKQVVLSEDDYGMTQSSEVALGLPPIVAYFEAANQLGLLRPSMTSVMNDYLNMSEYCVLHIPTELRHQLRERMRNLVVLNHTPDVRFGRRSTRLL